MARKIDSRLKINLTLAARTPLHVGGMGANVDTDLALAVNGAGDYYIPGTSLAGALRCWLETRADKVALKQIRRLWGHQKQKEERNEENAQAPQSEAEAQKKKKEEHASFVLIEDARISPPPGKQIVFTEIRDGVGIDRVTGAAANQIKFDRAILPRGTQLSFEMLVELGGDTIQQNDARFLTAAILQALQDGQVRFGAAKSRGLGRVTVVKQEICEQHFRSKTGMLATLRGHGATPHAVTGKPVALQPASRLEIDIAWQPRGPLMVKAEREGFAVDMLPLVSARDVMTGALSFVLPGSSIKGALRSQAERIVRTLLPIEVLKPVEKKQDFIKQVVVKEPDQPNTSEHASLIGWLFGIAGEPVKTASKAVRLPGISALTIDDCYSESASFNEQQWSAVEQANDEAELQKKLALANLGQSQQAFHVAIDRWLGGAADGALYSVLEPHGVSWEHLSLTLDLARLPDKEWQKRAVMLLLLTLRDFVAGRIPLGFGTNRGMGAVEVMDIQFTAHECGEKELDWLDGCQDIDLVGGKLNVPEALRKELNDAWTKWLPPAKGAQPQ